MSVSNPKISIIVPVYNSEKYLECCIQSILAQSFIDFELLLINDGSIDNSESICENYALKDSRIRIFNKKNGGVSSARNLGLAKALGEWVDFVDSDDVLYPDTLHHLYEQIYNKNVDFVTAGYEYVTDEGEVVYSTNSLVQYNNVYTKDKGITNLFECNYWAWFICSKLFRLSLIKKNHLSFDENIYFAEDRLFIIKYIVASKGNMCFSSKSVYKYRMHAGSACSLQKNDKQFNDRSITGFKASILMYKVLSKDNLSLYNHYLSLMDVVISYKTMKDLMKEHSIQVKSINERLNPILNEVMSCRRYHLLSFIRKLFNKFPFLKGKFKKFVCKTEV